MLSRSSSNAGDRLRRAKSTSSAHTTSSGHHRSSTSIDPFVTRHQAEIAAQEAYFRAAQHEAPALDHGYMPGPSKLERRRSQVTGKIEGEHFEDARLGRRRSTSKRDNAGNTRSAVRIQHQQQSCITDESNAEEGVVTRRRSVIPPNPQYEHKEYNQSSMSASDRDARYLQTGCSNGSPLPRTASTLTARTSNLQLRAPAVAHTGNSEQYVTHASDLSSFENAHSPTRQVPKVPIREKQTGEDIIAIARDKCLQDFQTKRVRERKSFILAPFQKRRVTTTQRHREVSYDTSLPPFNYADESVLPPPPPPPAIEEPYTTISSEKKTRDFSGTVIARFKRVFRKTSRAPSGVPPQHVPAKQFHFSTTPSVSTSVTHSSKDDDPFVFPMNNTRLAVPGPRVASASSKHSDDDYSLAKSRVTSWTNSTLGGTANSQDQAGARDAADEQGRLKRSDSVSTLRKASSFLGRSVKSRLRRPSRQQLATSEESAGLYSTLQERIYPIGSTADTGDEQEEPSFDIPSSRSALPSQQHNSTNPSRSRQPIATIRSVTPDSTAYKLGIPSPVTEVLSPEAALSHLDSWSKSRDDHSEPTPRSQLQRRPAVKATTPSKEQIARRVERSQKRWQSPLDEFSPLPMKTITTVENPYELSSLREDAAHSKMINISSHPDGNEQARLERRDLLSPSVYSRETDGATPRPETPHEPCETMITITGREVRSYSISPRKRDQKSQRPIEASNEWRRWLSQEMKGWAGTIARDGLALPEEFNASSNRVHEEVANPNGTEMICSESDVDHIVDMDRKYSAQSRRMHRHTSETAQNSSARRSEDDGLPVAQVEPAATSRRAVSKHQSLIQLQPADRGDTKYRSDKTTPPMPTFENLNSEFTKSKSTYKPKSPFDLRAKYRTGSSDKARPLEVHRKANNSEKLYILEDTTIQNISAGPYAVQKRVTSATTRDGNKENTPPSEANSLPVVSSSEWLAAGANKKRDSRKASNIHPAHRNRSASRCASMYAPSTSGNVSHSPADGGSPGQRLVTDWLEGKRSKENSPAAFM